ncbi:YhjD/YihY/BrkB family envelope integrity protein [Streptomyces sp. NPDC060194]|uniref:YhjD/YihY/BrkB family envelope integrity protein n=1 Tax=Streptomyces sp. NPDC060194 TaxID=3347069 RepID=UPI0036582E64
MSTEPSASPAAPAPPTGTASPPRFVTALERRMPFLRRLVDQIVAVHLFDSATRLAAQAFLSAIPVLFVVGAFAPQAVRDQLVASLREVMGLGGGAVGQVQEVLTTDDGGLQEPYGAMGVLVTLVSATACSRALQRVCERSWGLPPAGLRIVAWRWVAWLAVWLVALIAQGLLHGGIGAGPWLGVPLSLLCSTLLWWWTQHLLLGGRVAWLPLLPGAVLTGVAVVAVTWGSRFVMPGTVDRSVAQFGPLGAVFTLLSWLIVLFTCVTVGIAVGCAVAREAPVARRLGGAPAG